MGYKATIAIPCYNKENYIGRALDSIIELSRFKDFEIIIVDDCSKDNSVSIIKSYSQSYSNIKLIEFETGSGSPSKPRNVAIKESSAEYILFMDPDDFIVNDGYSVLLTSIEKYKSDIVIATRRGVNEAGLEKFVDYICKPFINENSMHVKLDLVKRRPFILKTIYRKSLLIDNNIYFNESISTSEDECFDMRCVAYADKITKINDIVYQYTVESEGSITTNISLKIYKEFYDILNELYDTYSLFLSPELVADRIIGLTRTFYINKLTFMDNADDVILARDLILEAFERFGYQHFDGMLMSRGKIMFWEDIKNKDIDKHIFQYMIKRRNSLNKAIKKLDKKNTKLTVKQNKLLNRKSVKAALKISNSLRGLKSSSKKTSDMTEYDYKYMAYLDKVKMLVDYKGNEYKGYWVFSDRFDAGRDNAEALYRYVMNNKLHDKIVFIISNEYSDYKRLKAEGFNVVNFGSVEHWLYVKNASYYFVAHCDNFILYPWYYIDKVLQKKIKRQYPVEYNYRMIFLQHGVIRSDLSGWLGNKTFDRIVTSSPYERKSILSITNYGLSEDQVILTGLPRWDYLKSSDCCDTIVVFPTWRKDLFKIGDLDNFKNSDFMKKWAGFLNHESFKELLGKYKVKLCLHNNNNFAYNVIRDSVDTNIEVIGYDDIDSFSELTNSAKMIITDYSSYSFDYLYLNKPVVYYDYDKNALNNNNKDEEYSKYGYYCTELADAIDALKRIVDSGFKLPEEKLQAIEKLLPIRDGKHCEHVIEQMKQEGV